MESNNTEQIASKKEPLGNSLPASLSVPSAFNLKQEKINFIDIHAFDHTSIAETAVALYTVIHQSSVTHQGLLATKSVL